MSQILPPNSADQSQMAKSASIDALIGRIHSMARQMHEMGQSVSSRVQAIAARGEQSVDRFDSNFGTITMDVEQIYGSANRRQEEVPAGVVILLACTLGILLVLALAWMGGILAERILLGRRRGMRGMARSEEQTF